MKRRVFISTGDRFSRLMVVGEAEPAIRARGHHVRQFLCRCECGSLTTVRMDHLRSGAIKSCGCLTQS